MNEFLAIVIGFLGALMMTMNGELGRGLGSVPGNLFVHVSGLALVALFLGLGRRGPRLPRGTKLPQLSGGALGFASVLLVNLAFPALGVALTLGLSLLGQAIASVAIDATGMLWAKRRPFRPRILLSLALIAAGIATMSLASASPAVSSSGIRGMANGLLALLAGCSTVAGRRVNARLAAETDALTSVFWNYAIGTGCAVLALGALLALGSGGTGLLGQMGRDANGHAPAFLSGEAVAALMDTLGRIPSWSWFGGAVGLLFVLLSNRVTPRLGAYAMALLVFLGQVGGSLVIEFFLYGTLETAKLAGGSLILAGLLLKSFLERGTPAETRA